MNRPPCCKASYAEGYKDALLGEWISLSDKSPNEGEEVLTYDAMELAYSTAIFIEGKFKSNHFCESPYIENVTYWMPLKAPEKIK